MYTRRIIIICNDPIMRSHKRAKHVDRPIVLIRSVFENSQLPNTRCSSLMRSETREFSATNLWCISFLGYQSIDRFHSWNHLLTENFKKKSCRATITVEIDRSFRVKRLWHDKDTWKQTEEKFETFFDHRSTFGIKINLPRYYFF